VCLFLPNPLKVGQAIPMRVLVATKYKENLVVVRQLSPPEKKIDFSVVFKKFRLDRNCPYYTRCSNYSLNNNSNNNRQ
jgi:hypothetical protein